MDRGEGQRDNLASLEGLEGVAANASARVGEILAEAERLARDVHAEADRAAAATRGSAEAEAERIAEEAREAARAAARERVEELATLQAALTGRGPAVVEGLEGAGMTRARLEAVIEALAAAAEQVLAEAEDGDPHAPGEAAEQGADAAEDAGGSDTAAGEAEDAAAEEDGGTAAIEETPEAASDPVAAAEDLAKPVAGAVPAGGAEAGAVPAVPSVNGDGGGNGSAPYEGTLPDGAPLARKPKRSRERDARFAALLLAVQGRPRDEVDAHLRSEYGFADVEPILDEVFGPAPA